MKNLDTKYVVKTLMNELLEGLSDKYESNVCYTMVNANIEEFFEKVNSTLFDGDYNGELISLNIEEGCIITNNTTTWMSVEERYKPIADYIKKYGLSDSN